MINGVESMSGFREPFEGRSLSHHGSDAGALTVLWWLGRVLVNRGF